MSRFLPERREVQEMSEALASQRGLAGSFVLIVAGGGGQGPAYQLAGAVARAAGAGTLVDLHPQPLAGSALPEHTLADVLAGACTLACACAAAADLPGLQLVSGGSLSPEQLQGGAVVEWCRELCGRGPVLAVVPARQAPLLDELLDMADAAVFVCGCSLDAVLELRRTQQALYERLPARCFGLVEGGDQVGSQLRPAQVEAWLRPLPVYPSVEDVLGRLVAEPVPGAVAGSAQIARQRLLALKQRDEQPQPAMLPSNALQLDAAPGGESLQGPVVETPVAAPSAAGVDGLLQRARAFLEDKRRLAALEEEVQRLHQRLAAESQALQKAFEY